MTGIKITYYGFGGFDENNEPLAIMRAFSDDRTPEALHLSKGWTPTDSMRTYVSSGEAWEISEEQARKVAAKYGFSL